MSEQTRNEKEEKDQGDSWDEKWRSDPLTAAWWAMVLIWAGLVLIADNMGLLNNLGFEGQGWALGFLGAGVLALVLVAVRLVVPAYRRPVMGSTILGFILIGIGLGEVTGHYEVIGALILIAIGVSYLVRGFFRGS